MKLKPGVKVTGLRPEMVLGCLAVQKVCDELGVPFVVTSAVEGKHSSTSLHYAGCAIDIRTNNMKGQQAKARDMIDDALGIDFDCLDEGNHLHLEFQPRRNTA
jgi:D-alanyl-D-alanine dipeptidase